MNRQIHDFFHTLTNVPITVRGELALKWFEYAQTGLPMNILAGMVAPPLSSVLSTSTFPFSIVNEQIISILKQYNPENGMDWNGYWEKDVLWGLQAGSKAPFLLSVYFEKEFETDCNELRDRLNIWPYR